MSVKFGLPTAQVVFVDEPAEVHKLCEQWRAAGAEKNKTAAADTYKHRLLLGIDLEGRDLGHDGTVDILAIYDDAANITYLFDVTTMQERAFTRCPEKGLWSLKELIEIGGGSAGIGKDDDAAKGSVLFLVFDTRMDSSALFHIYGVRLGGARPSTGPLFTPFGGVYDLQVAKCLLVGGTYLIGLAKTLGLYMTRSDNAATAKGKRVYAPEEGGSYDAWGKRPMPDDLVQYCAVTIRYYGLLFRQVAETGFGPSVQKVMLITEQRICRQVAQKVPKMRSAQRDF